MNGTGSSDADTQLWSGKAAAIDPLRSPPYAPLLAQVEGTEGFDLRTVPSLGRRSDISAAMLFFLQAMGRQFSRKNGRC